MQKTKMNAAAYNLIEAAKKLQREYEEKKRHAK